MRQRRWRIHPVWVFGCLLLWSAQVQAEQDLSQLFRQGVDHFTNGRHEQALETFESLYEARQVPGVLYNIAMCQQALGRVPNSVNTFRRYLAEEEPSRIGAEDRAEIERLMESMRPAHANLVIEVPVEGAAVEIDGEEVGTSPLGRPIAVAAGEHAVAANLEGHAPIEHTVSVRNGQTTTVNLPLEPITEVSESENEETEETESPSEPEEPETTSPEVQEDEPDTGMAETPRRRLGWWFWTPLALSAASAIGMAVTGGLTLSYHDQYTASEQLDIDAYETGTALAVGTDTLLGVSLGTGALALVALIVHYVRNRDRRGEVETSDSLERSLAWIVSSNVSESR